VNQRAVAFRRSEEAWVGVDLADVWQRGGQMDLLIDKGEAQTCPVAAVKWKIGIQGMV
jgi:hypothetical protein